MDGKVPNVIKERFKRAPEQYPKHIHLVDTFDTSVVQAARSLGLPVLEADENNNGILEPKCWVIYVLKEFESDGCQTVPNRTPNFWILGQTALLEMEQNPLLRLRSKPTYCTFMFGFVLYIKLARDIPLMIRLFTLVKWMGGRVEWSPSKDTTHMITISSFASGYHYCYTFNLKILTPGWVEECWANRHNCFFDTQTIMEKHKVLPFSGLHLCFRGFSFNEQKCLEQLAEEYGGVVVSQEDPTCTHLVTSSVEHREGCKLKMKFLVTVEWFHECISSKERVYEEIYSCDHVRPKATLRPSQENTTTPITLETHMGASAAPSPLKAVNENRSISTLQPTLPGHGFQAGTENLGKNIHPPSCTSPQVRRRLRRSQSCERSSSTDPVQNDEELEHQNLKRKYVCEELCQTEVNYLKSLEHLLVIRNSAYNRHRYQPILSETEANLIFNNLEEIVKIHEYLCGKLKKMLQTSNSDLMIGELIISVKNELMKEYVTYARGVTESQEAFLRCKNTNHLFKTVLKMFRRKSHCEDIKDIFIYPIQRLCRILLLLKEIKKHTRDNSPDKQSLAEAITIVNDVLKKMNEGRSCVDKFRSLMEIHSRIENCPAYLINSNRDFIVKFYTEEYKENTKKDSVPETLLVLFLFNDILEVTKLKGNGCKRDGTVQAFKHIEMFSMSVILNVVSFEDKEQNLFGLTFRSLENENESWIHCFKLLDSSMKLDNLLLMIAEQLQRKDISKSLESFILRNVPLNWSHIKPIHQPTVNQNFCTGVTKIASTIISKVTNKKRMGKRSFSCSDLPDF